MPRAWPSFSVARASLLTKVSSTAASSGPDACDDGREAVVNRDAGGRRARPSRPTGSMPQATKASSVAVRLDDAPAGAAEPRIDADDANRLPQATFAEERLSRNVEIGVDMLDVVIVLDGGDELHQLLSGSSSTSGGVLGRQTRADSRRAERSSRPAPTSPSSRRLAVKTWPAASRATSPAPASIAASSTWSAVPLSAPYSISPTRSNRKETALVSPRLPPNLAEIGAHGRRQCGCGCRSGPR